MGKIILNVKVGVLLNILLLAVLMFLPGLTNKDKPLKDISHLMNDSQKFALIS